MLLFPYLMSCPSAFVVCHSDCTTSLSNLGVRPLHTPFQCVSSFLFHSAWTAPECFLLGCQSLKLDMPLLYSIPGRPGSCLVSKPRAHSISLCRCGLCLSWPSGTWHGKSLAPVLPHVPQSLTGCASLGVGARLQGEEEGRRSSALLLLPLYWASLGRSAAGLVMVAPEEHRGITLRKTERAREWESDLTGTGWGENSVWVKGWTQRNEGREDGRMKVVLCHLTHSLSGYITSTYFGNSTLLVLVVVLLQGYSLRKTLAQGYNIILHYGCVTFPWAQC